MSTEQAGFAEYLKQQAWTDVAERYKNYSEHLTQIENWISENGGTRTAKRVFFQHKFSRHVEQQAKVKDLEKWIQVCKHYWDFLLYCFRTYGAPVNLLREVVLEHHRYFVDVVGPLYYQDFAFTKWPIPSFDVQLMDAESGGFPRRSPFSGCAGTEIS